MAELKAHLAGMAGEAIVAARRARDVDTDGTRAREIVGLLAVRGAMTPKRLRIELADPGLSQRGVTGYLTALERAGLVEVLALGSRRGQARYVVELTADGRARASVALGESA